MVLKALKVLFPWKAREGAWQLGCQKVSCIISAWHIYKMERPSKDGEQILSIYLS